MLLPVFQLQEEFTNTVNWGAKHKSLLVMDSELWNVEVSQTKTAVELPATQTSLTYKMGSQEILSRSF